MQKELKMKEDPKKKVQNYRTEFCGYEFKAEKENDAFLSYNKKLVYCNRFNNGKNFLSRLYTIEKRLHTNTILLAYQRESTISTISSFCI